jgi:hypothetical protein
VPPYLGSLAGRKVACPCAAVLAHSRLHKTPGHQLDSGVGPGMAKALEGVKDLASEMCGYEWQRLWSWCDTVKADARTRNVHPFQPKRRTIFQDVLQLLN